ncbi:hypothetical protein J6590_015718 [Homalodisca vitripennis]|nr:hypothetical protein J6590_015718 [Homalodisca vitripennis]
MVANVRPLTCRKRGDRRGVPANNVRAPPPPSVICVCAPPLLPPAPPHRPPLLASPRHGIPGYAVPASSLTVPIAKLRRLHCSVQQFDYQLINATALPSYFVIMTYDKTSIVLHKHS